LPYQPCAAWLRRREQERSNFGYGYSIYQVEHSRNLLFHLGGQMEAVFDAVVDPSRSRLDVATLRTLFGTKQQRRARPESGGPHQVSRRRHQGGIGLT
jgi:hypothetical protein